MSPREDLDRFMTPEMRRKVDEFVAESANEDDDVDMGEVIRQNLADHEAALTGRNDTEGELNGKSFADDDWTALWHRICQVATDQPGVQPDMEPERLVRILSREKRPSALDVAQIADAFGVTVSHLLTGSDHGMCEGTIAALQEELRRGFEYSQRQDEEIARLKQQLLEARGHDEGCEGGHAGTADCADITTQRMEQAHQLRYLEAVLDVFRQADSYESLLWRRTYAGLRFSVMCSDTFAWASADAEIIEPEDLPLLRQTLADLKAADSQLGECDLPELFAARKRGMRPMRLFLWPKRQREDPGWPAVRELFLAAGPERDPATEG